MIQHLYLLDVIKTAKKSEKTKSLGSDGKHKEILEKL
jgi:hypothetical protein